jgi:phospholipase/carboxylesterase
MLQETLSATLPFLEPKPSQSSNGVHKSRLRPYVPQEKGLDIEFPYRLFVPEAYEPNYAYPLVVWLHSDHSSELELDGVMQALSPRNYVGIAPRANCRSRSQDNTYRWGSTPTECAVAEDLVWDSVQAAIEKLSVHPDRIFLAGFGGGGTMAQWIGLKYSKQVAGVASISGCFPRTPRSLSNWKSARSIPILFTQTLGSSLCSEDQMIRALRVSHQAGLNYQFVQAQPAPQALSNDELWNGGDDLDSDSLAMVNRFFMGLVTNSPVDLRGECIAEQSGSLDDDSLEFRFN